MSTLLLTSLFLCAQAGAESIDSGVRPVARFEPSGLVYEAAHGPVLRIGAVELERGDRSLALRAAAPVEAGSTTLFVRAPGVVERFAQRVDGIEHSLELSEPVVGDGDLVVRFALGGDAACAGQRRPDGSHDFAGITYGTLVAIDAAGERTAGDVRLVDGGLEWVVDDAWLDAAAWPVLLDPLVGSSSAVTSATTTEPWGDFDPDVAYDATNDVYLVVWERLFDNDQRIVHARRVSGSGTPLGSEFQLTGVYPSFEPRVANLPASDRFAVTWLQDFFGTTQLRMIAVDAATGALSNNLLVATDAPGVISGHDLAGDTTSAIFSTPRAHAIWRNGEGIHHSRVAVPSSGDISVTSDTIVAPDSDIFVTLVEPSVSRTTSNDGRLGIAFARTSLTTRSIQMMVIDRNSNVLQAPTTISGNDPGCKWPSIDGGGSGPTRYVVTWTSFDNVQIETTLRSRAVASSGTITLGTTQTLEYFPDNVTYETTVGWRPGAVFVVYNLGGGAAGNSSIAGLDATTGVVGFDQTAVSGSSAGGVSTRPLSTALCMESSGGSTIASDGMLIANMRVFGFSGGTLLDHSWLTRRLVDAFGNGASATLIGGACGPVGSISAPQPPALGNGTFRIELVGAPLDATVAILNIAAPQATLDCGTCRWVPFATTYLLPVNSGNASQALPVPLAANLAGITAWAQWTVIAPSTSGCAAVPGVGTSQILELDVE
jgi:hypothetical protein